MHKITLVNIRFSAVAKIAAETHKVIIPNVPHCGRTYPARIDAVSYPRIDDGDITAYTFECESVNASMRRLRRVYAALGGRMNPPWTGYRIDGKEVNGNRKDEE